jgi:hypothetical protein
MIHNKGMIIDNKWIWVSSFNWNPTSGLENREVGILIGSEEAAGYLKKVMLHDMGGWLQDRMDIRKEWVKGGYEKDDLVSMEVGLDIIWEDEEMIDVELISCMIENGSTTCRVLATETISGPFEGHIVLSSDELHMDDEEGIMMVRVREEQIYFDAFLIESSPVEMEEKDDRMGWSGSSWVPFVLIAITALLISFGKVMFRRKERYHEE